MTDVTSLSPAMTSRTTTYDSDATEDEFVSPSGASSDHDHDHAPTPTKRPRLGRALQQLLVDRTAPASKPLALHDAAIKAAIRRGSELGAPRARRRSVPTPRFGVQHSTMPTLHLERDTAMLQCLLEKRPFFIHRPQSKDELLTQVVRALQRIGGWPMTVQTVRRQLKWLGHVRLAEDHAEHAHLMAEVPLKEMVTAFYETSDDALQRLLETINAGADAAARPSSTSAITFDDVLLLEVLQRRPHEASKKTIQGEWDALATVLNERLGVKVFFSGTSCRNRVARLRAVARSPRHDPLVELSVAQTNMLAELERGGPTPSGGKRRRRLRRSRDGDDDGEPEPEEIHYSSLASDDESSIDNRARGTGTQRLRGTSPHDPTDEMDVADDLIEGTEGQCDRVGLMDQPRRKPIQRQNSAEAQKHPVSGGDEPRPVNLRAHSPPPVGSALESVDIIADPRPSPPVVNDASIHLATTLETRNRELEAVIARDRHAFDTERESLTSRVASLEQSVQSLQASAHGVHVPSVTWMEQLEEERRQHNAQIEMLMTMLKTEREAQRSETRAMLDTIAAERREQLQALAPLLALMDRDSNAAARQQRDHDGRGTTEPLPRDDGRHASRV